MTALISFFCGCHLCIGNHPLTSIGTVPQRWHTVAAPRHIPLGTEVYIETIGLRVVETRTALRYNGRWDVYVGNWPGAHQHARKLGIQKLNITIQ